MKRLFYLFLLFFISFKSFAEPGIDSLKTLLDNHKAEDSTRVLLLLKYGKASFFTKADSMMYYADEALRIAQKIKWPQGIADSYQLKGVSYSYVLSDPVNAIDYYQKALVANEPLKRKRFEWQTLANIALLYHDQEEYAQALSYYKKAKAILATLPDKSGEGRLLMNMGHLHFDMGHADEAMQDYQESLSISEKNGDSLATANVLNSIGYIFLQQKNYSNAKDYITRSIQMADLTGNEVTKASALVNMSLLKLQNKAFLQAEKYGKEGLELSKAVGNLQFQRQAWDALEKVYEQTGRYRLSLDAYKEYILLNDSLISSEKKKEITRKEMQFQFDKKRALDQAELKRQRTIKNALMGGAAFILLAALSGIVLYKKKRDAEGEKKEAEFKTLVSDTEMKALRAQMNPHFIFNSLNAIGDYMMKNNAKMADDYLKKFSALMRLVLENSEQKEVLLSDDIKALELYMELEALRLNHQFTFEIKTDDNIDIENTLVPPLLLQPFVENSIRHGLSAKEGPGHIRIQFKVEGDLLICNIEDNGIGIPNAVKKESFFPGIHKKSLGIKITQSRIHILNRHKKIPLASMKIHELKQGTNVEIKLPLALNF
ncbi:MAG: tetratricopeptide repeat protein [Bacteroidota bacterium]|nr:tetratricopeptide repeat protein [Bacteroidota bacterium]